MCAVTSFDTSSLIDPLLAKIMVHAPSRTEAIALMRSTLANTRLCGPPTNVEFLQAIIDSSGMSFTVDMTISN
jgi:acetyl/propionyl-CoA carboxylase alpha subunit